MTDTTFKVMISRSVRESTEVVVAAPDLAAAERRAIEMGKDATDWGHDVDPEYHVSWSQHAPKAASGSNAALKTFWRESDAVIEFCSEHCAGEAPAGAVFDGRRILLTTPARDAFSILSLVDGWYTVHKGSDVFLLADPEAEHELVCKTGDIEHAFDQACDSIGMTKDVQPSP